MPVEDPIIVRGVTADPRPDIEGLLLDPAVRSPLKAVLRGWLSRDPIDIASDADLLAAAFGRRADEGLSRSVGQTGDPS